MVRPVLLSLRSALERHAQTQLNRWVDQSSAAQQERAALEGRSLCVEIENTRLRALLSVESQRACFAFHDEQIDADIVVRAGAFDLLELLRASSVAQLSGGSIEFRGSLRIAEQFAKMLRLARPQLEDELAGWLGGVPAHALARTIDAGLGWSTQASHAVMLDVVEYLQLESRELPVPDEIAQFMLEVERLRDDVERIAQRIDRLATPVGR